MFLTHILLLFAVGFPGGEGRLRLRNGGRSMDLGRAAVEHLVVATCLRWIWVARVIRPPSRSKAQHSRSPDPATGDLNRTWRRRSNSKGHGEGGQAVTRQHHTWQARARELGSRCSPFGGSAPRGLAVPAAHPRASIRHAGSIFTLRLSTSVTSPACARPMMTPGPRRRHVRGG